MPMFPLLTQFAAGSSLLALLFLHLVSAEFHPSWRMISEYALGKQKWLITAFFLLWGLSSFFAAGAAWSHCQTLPARIGCLLLVLAGVGEVMGGLFDIKHKLHGLSFMLGVPALPIATLILSYTVQVGHSNQELQVIAHGTWLALVIMGVSMAHMFGQFKKAGLALGPEAQAPERLPDGMRLFNGYANRLLVLVYHAWVILFVSYLS